VISFFCQRRARRDCMDARCKHGTSENCRRDWQIIQNFRHLKNYCATYGAKASLSMPRRHIVGQWYTSTIGLSLPPHCMQATGQLYTPAVLLRWRKPTVWLYYLDSAGL